MLKHWVVAHKGVPRPKFNQYVVKSCLERQVGEFIRIQLRGNTFNSAGVYNICKLTRLEVDTDWDKKVWMESWSKPTIPEEEQEATE